ncbi:MAG: helix-turn-helix domain-containing protein [Bacteroidetes bacterium]|nr:helix-turn-helix domain-containing protein [Bacteroidota bacterium]
MNEELFDELERSVREGGKILKGKRRANRVFDFDSTDPRVIRERLGLSQSKFAKLLGISVSTLQNWEQGRRKPDGPAKVLLNVAAKYPEAIFNTVFH